jgi:hypothetical protein
MHRFGLEPIHDSDFVSLLIHEGILIGYYKKGAKINLQAAKNIVKTRLEFCNYKIYPVLAINLGIFTFDKEARDYLSSDEGIQGISAGGIFIDTQFTAILCNVYLKITKPRIPTKSFDNIESAIKWLSNFKSI